MFEIWPPFNQDFFPFGQINKYIRIFILFPLVGAKICSNNLWTISPFFFIFSSLIVAISNDLRNWSFDSIIFVHNVLINTKNMKYVLPSHFLGLNQHIFYDILKFLALQMSLLLFSCLDNLVKTDLTYIMK